MYFIVKLTTSIVILKSSPVLYTKLQKSAEVNKLKSLRIRFMSSYYFCQTVAHLQANNRNEYYKQKYENRELTYIFVVGGIMSITGPVLCVSVDFFI